MMLGVLGSLALGAMSARAMFGEEEESRTKQAARQRKRQQQTFQSITPRGLTWWAASNDYPQADDMPRLLQVSDEDGKFWESLPVHAHPSDPFAQHENYVEALVSSKQCNLAHLEQIMRDIPRTFPDEDYFRDTDVQDTMRRVLMAVCVEYPEIGYVQSMNFLAGFLFLHSKTEDACFGLFRRLLSHPRLRMAEMYKPGLPLLFRVLEVLKKLTMRHAKRCFDKFEQLGLEFIMFAQTWFMTLFTYSMDWSTCGPVWDIFFERGWEGPLRVALFMIRENEHKILQGDFDGVGSVLRDACMEAPIDIAQRSLVLHFDETDKALIDSVVDF